MKQDKSLRPNTFGVTILRLKLQISCIYDSFVIIMTYSLKNFASGHETIKMRLVYNQFYSF